MTPKSEKIVHSVHVCMHAYIYIHTVHNVSVDMTWANYLANYAI